MSDADGETAPFVDPGFEPPLELVLDRVVLRPLGPEHNESDHRAWTSSIDHIRASPGFGPEKDWPEPGMPLARNRQDLVDHRDDFEAGRGFTYTVLDRSHPDTVVGCLYLYPDPTGRHHALARSWVTEAWAEIDGDLRVAIDDWLRADWPFPSYRYDGVPTR